MTTIASESLDEIPRYEASRIGRHVYCHHCRVLSRMDLLGRDALGRVVYFCRRKSVAGGWCQGVVRVELSLAMQ